MTSKYYVNVRSERTAFNTVRTWNVFDAVDDKIKAIEVAEKLRTEGKEVAITDYDILFYSSKGVLK